MRDTDSYANCDGNSYAYTDSYANSYGNSHAYTDSYGNGHSNSYAYTDSYGNGDSDRYAYTDSYANGDGDAYVPVETNPDTKAISDAAASPIGATRKRLCGNSRENLASSRAKGGLMNLWWQACRLRVL